MIQQSSASFTIYTSVLTGIFLVSLIQDTERGGVFVVLSGNTLPVKMQFVLKTIFVVLFCVAIVSSLPKPMEEMDIYKYEL